MGKSTGRRVGPTSIDQYVGMGTALHDIGKTPAACRMANGPDGEQRIVSATFHLPGTRDEFGMVQIGQDDGSRWMLSDGQGWLTHEFPTLHDGVEALLDPKRRAAMREHSALMMRLYDMQRQARELDQRIRERPAVEGALPLD